MAKHGKENTCGPHGFLSVLSSNGCFPCFKSLMQVGEICLFSSHLLVPHNKAFYFHRSTQKAWSLSFIPPEQSIPTHCHRLFWFYSYPPFLCSHKDTISIHSILSNSRNGGRSYVLGIKILCLFPLPNLVSHSLTSLKIILSHQIILLKNGSMQGQHKYPKEHQKPIKFTSLHEIIFHKLFNFPLSMVFIHK